MIQKDIEVGLAVIQNPMTLPFQVIQTHCHGFLFYGRGLPSDPIRRCTLSRFSPLKCRKFQKLYNGSISLEPHRCRRAISYSVTICPRRIASDVTRRAKYGRVCLFASFHPPECVPGCREIKISDKPVLGSSTAIRTPSTLRVSVFVSPCRESHCFDLRRYRKS